MKSIRETLERAVKALSDAGVDHALIGGLALGGLGVHRATVDVDLLVEESGKDAAKQALIGQGFVVAYESDEVIQFKGSGRLDLLLARRAPTRGMLESARPLERLGVKCVAAEDLIGLKIQAYVNNPRRLLQDQADIAALIASVHKLDWDRIKSHADLFGEWETIQSIRKLHEL